MSMVSKKKTDRGFRFKKTIRCLFTTLFTHNQREESTRVECNGICCVLRHSCSPHGSSRHPPPPPPPPPPPAEDIIVMSCCCSKFVTFVLLLLLLLLLVERYLIRPTGARAVECPVFSWQVGVAFDSASRLLQRARIRAFQQNEFLVLGR
jgi:hypothetical protein